MAAENALQFLRSLERGNCELPPALAISGPNAFLREYALDAIRRHLMREAPVWRGFQVGAGDNYAGVLQELTSTDLFAIGKLVVCRVLRSHRQREEAAEADGDAAKPASRTGADERSLAAAIAALRAPARLVLLYERETLPAAIGRALERGLAIGCARPFDDQMEAYAGIFARALGLKLETEAAAALAESYPGDLAGIENALQRAAIGCGPGGVVSAAEVALARGMARAPELFELSTSLAQDTCAGAVALFDRAVAGGRDPIELLAVEIIPTLRRMLLAATLLGARKPAAAVAAAMGFPPSSRIAMAAIDGARRIGLGRLEIAYRHACRLDADFKAGLRKERVEAIAALLLETAQPARRATAHARG